MAIGVQTFRPLTMQETNPYLTGFQTGQSIVSNEQKMQAADLANAMSKIDLQYHPQMTQADLALKQEMAPYYHAQTGLTNEQAKWFGPTAQSEIALRGSQIPLNQANANYANEQARFLPIDNLIKGVNASRLGSRFGDAYQLSKMLTTMDPSSRETWIAQHQDAYNDMLSTIGNKAASSQSIFGQDFLSNEMTRLFGSPQNAMQKQQPGGMPQGGMQQPGNMQQPTVQQPTVPPQNAQMPNGMQPPAPQGAFSQQHQPILPLEHQQVEDPHLKQAQDELQKRTFVSTPAQDEQMRIASQDAANRKSVGSVINNRADAAAAMESWLENNRAEYAPRIKNAAQYAGQTGNLKRKTDALLPESMQPEGYKDWAWYKGVFRGNLANLVKQMEKLNGDQTQREELLNLVGTIDRADLGKKGTIDVFNKTIKTLGDTSQSVFDAAEPRFKGVYRRKYNLPRLTSNYLDTDESAGNTEKSSAAGKSDSGKSAGKVRTYNLETGSFE